MVDIDLETVINFCDKFEKEYLEILHQNAQSLKERKWQPSLL